MIIQRWGLIQNKLIAWHVWFWKVCLSSRVWPLCCRKSGCSHLMKFTASHVQCLLAWRYTEVIVPILFLFVCFSQFFKQHASLTFFGGVCSWHVPLVSVLTGLHCRHWKLQKLGVSTYSVIEIKSRQEPNTSKNTEKKDLKSGSNHKTENLLLKMVQEI